MLTAGPRGDAPQAPAWLDGLRAKHVVADAAYDSDAIRRQITAQGGKACIKPNPTRKRQKRYDRRRYKRRNVIERLFRRSGSQAADRLSIAIGAGQLQPGVTGHR